ncbi:hypothetical protein pb186bvf_001526 [Paramecium bursaria]
MGSSCQKSSKTASCLENDLISPKNHDFESDLNIKTNKYCLYPKFMEPQTFTFYSKSDVSDFSSEENCKKSPQLTLFDNICSIQSELENYLECDKSSDPPSVPLKVSQFLSFELKKEDQNFISLQSCSPRLSRLSGQFQRIRNKSIQQEQILNALI